MHDTNDSISALTTASLEINDLPLSIEKKDHLVSLIDELILHHFNALVQLLYRLDVNEKKLKRLIAQNPPADAASVIADLIIERQIQKANSRNIFRQDETCDEEQW